MNIRPVGAELLHADGRADTDRTTLLVAFRNYPDAPKHFSSFVDVINT